MKSVLLITEYINPPFDEGIKKTVYNLFCLLEQKYKVEVICRIGFQKENIKIVKTNKLFKSKIIKNYIKNFNPSVLIYFPFASTTFAGYLRFYILSKYSVKSKNILFALQPKSLKTWQKILVRLIKPYYALTPSPELHLWWNKIHVNNTLVPLPTDLTIFHPLAEDKNKDKLREKYNLPIDAYIISHMGHLNEGRNLKSLITLQQSGNQIVVVCSSSTPKDSFGPLELKKQLLQSGIIIIDKFISNIEEIYQLSDLYIFPVLAKNSSIGMPLSVLEARACGIPVLTTNFGSLQHFLKTDYGSIVYSDPNGFNNAVDEIKLRKNYNFSLTKVNDINNLFYGKLKRTIGN